MLRRSLVALVVVLKYGLPALLPRYPFRAGWANFALDSVDGDILVPLGLSNRTYQGVDKSADYATYVAMTIAARRWPIFPSVVALFALRSVGQAIYFLTRRDGVFFLFPNFLEPLFLCYATIRHLKGPAAPGFYARHRRALWAGVIAYKLQDEYVTHVARVDRTDLLASIFRRHRSSGA